MRAHASARPKALTARQEAIDTLRGKKDAAVKLGDFDTAAQYREAIRQASAEFSEELKKWKATHAEETIEVTEADIAAIFRASL